jgi:hypothetical protein
MASLQEILERDLNLGEEKTASVNSAASADDDEIMKLASELGLDKAAEDEEKEDKEEEKEEEDEDEGEEKKSSAEMGSLYNDLFPEDSDLGGSTKTAEESKLAEYQENMGARTFDHFAARFDARIEKIAVDALTGGATISSPKASVGGDKGTEESIPPQGLPSNKITTPIAVKNIVVTDEVKAKNDEKTVGHFEQKVAMAMRKRFIVGQLEQ